MWLLSLLFLHFSYILSFELWRLTLRIQGGTQILVSVWKIAITNHEGWSCKVWCTHNTVNPFVRQAQIGTTLTSSVRTTDLNRTWFCWMYKCHDTDLRSLINKMLLLLTTLKISHWLQRSLSSWGVAASRHDVGTHKLNLRSERHASQMFSVPRGRLHVIPVQCGWVAWANVQSAIVWLNPFKSKPRSRSRPVWSTIKKLSRRLWL